MKKLTRCLWALCLGGGVVLAVPAQGANHTRKATPPATQTERKPAREQATSKVKKAPAAATKEVSRAGKTTVQARVGKAKEISATKDTSRDKDRTAAARTEDAKACPVRKGTKNKGARSRRAAAPLEPALQSPIQDNALSKSAPAPGDKNLEVKARTAPDRAYAVDGETFFYQGRKYRVAGLTGTGGSDMAKQRLQKLLESGNLMVQPVSTDDAGVSIASVRINGRDLADLLQ